MGEYRDFIQKTVTGKTKKRHRGWIYLVVLFVAVFAYISESGDMSYIKKISLRTLNDISQLDAVDAISMLYSSSFGDRELPIYSVENDKKQIALTFDAAWGAEDFHKIMKILDKHKVKVTFFMTGEWAEKNPDCVKELVEKGHDLGNHSENHYDMTTLSEAEMRAEIQDCHDRVKKLADYDMKLFRPPYGAYNNGVIKMAEELKYYPIQWSVDSLDWKDYGVESIISTVCNHKALEPGAIILCHNGAKYTAQALDDMITKLKSDGYELVPVSELILKENYHMDAAGKQIPD